MIRKCLTGILEMNKYESTRGGMRLMIDEVRSAEVRRNSVGVALTLSLIHHTPLLVLPFVDSWETGTPQSPCGILLLFATYLHSN
jgi:hypothetical protein